MKKVQPCLHDSIYAQTFRHTAFVNIRKCSRIHFSLARLKVRPKIAVSALLAHLHTNGSQLSVRGSASRLGYAGARVSTSVETLDGVPSQPACLDKVSDPLVWSMYLDEKL